VASLVWDDRFNPSIEILFILRNKITESMNLLHDEISNVPQKCNNISDLMDQFELLSQMYFTNYKQLLNELNYPLGAEQSKIHDLFMSATKQIKLENNKCNDSVSLIDFTRLRLDFAYNTSIETMILCDIIKANFG